MKNENSKSIKACTFFDPTQEEREVLGNILQAIGTEADIVVLKHSSVDLTQDTQLYISFGIVSTRFLEQKLKDKRKIIELPSLKELIPKEENRAARTEAALKIESIKQILRQSVSFPIVVKRSEIENCTIPEDLEEYIHKKYRVEKDGKLIEVSNFKSEDADIHLTIEELYVAIKLMDLVGTDKVEVDEEKA